MRCFFCVTLFLLVFTSSVHAQKFRNDNSKVIFKGFFVPTLFVNHIGFGIESPVADKVSLTLYSSNFVIIDPEIGPNGFLSLMTFSGRVYHKSPFNEARKINWGYNGYLESGIGVMVGALQSDPGGIIFAHFTLGQHFQLSETISMDLGAGIFNPLPPTWTLLPMPRINAMFGIRRNDRIKKERP